MDVDEAARSLLSNTGLLAATLGVIAAIRGGVPKRRKGICQSCGGRGVKDCTLCYGKGFLVTPGYVNFADPRHRRLCTRCDGSRTTGCTACGCTNGQGRMHAQPLGNSGSKVSKASAEVSIRNIPRAGGRRTQRSVPVEQHDDEF